MIIEVESAFGWVILDLLASILVLFWLSFAVTNARNRYGVDYTDIYAIRGITRNAKTCNVSDTDTEGLLSLPDADCEAFNSYQRAYQNMLESYTQFCVLLLMGGLQYPRLSAFSGAIWILGRVAYSMGFQSGVPSRRRLGSFGYTGLVILIGLNLKIAWNLLVP
eukprot:GHVR01175803.1.p1 GENE.GHVR01175803.1~~GHVR01175803.1.p1  ORF type:complete len:164 (+),score=18.17 GHVR01175803.1:187-678(+)